jgi:hypothetical protein
MQGIELMNWNNEKFSYFHFGNNSLIKTRKMTTLEMEVAIMKDCNVHQNVVVPNVSFGISRINNSGIYELHECDVLKVSNSGYATEFEIKISKSDFKADLTKKHNHCSRFIKQMYYVVPFEMLEFAKDNIKNEAGLAYVKYGHLFFVKTAGIRPTHFKWSDEEILKLAKLGTMRILGLKEKILNLKL